MNNGTAARAVDPWSPVNNKQNTTSAHVLSSTLNEGKQIMKNICIYTK